MNLLGKGAKIGLYGGRSVDDGDGGATDFDGLGVKSERRDIRTSDVDLSEAQAEPGRSNGLDLKGEVVLLGASLGLVPNEGG